MNLSKANPDDCEFHPVIVLAAGEAESEQAGCNYTIQVAPQLQCTAV
jgi:hypothetical protein